MKTEGKKANFFKAYEIGHIYFKPQNCNTQHGRPFLLASSVQRLRWEDLPVDYPWRDGHFIQVDRFWKWKVLKKSTKLTVITKRFCQLSNLSHSHITVSVFPCHQVLFSGHVSTQKFFQSLVFFGGLNEKIGKNNGQVFLGDVAVNHSLLSYGNYLSLEFWLIST